MAELPNPNPSRASGGDGEKRKRATTQLDTIKLSYGELSSINIGLKTLNDNFSAYIAAFMSNADDAARAAREAALERDRPLGGSGTTKQKKFTMPDLTGGFGMGKVVLIGLLALFTELDTWWRATSMALKGIFFDKPLKLFLSAHKLVFGGLTTVATALGKLILPTKMLESLKSAWKSVFGRDSFLSKIGGRMRTLFSVEGAIGKLFGPAGMIGKLFSTGGMFGKVSGWFTTVAGWFSKLAPIIGRLAKFNVFVMVIMGLIDFVKGFIDKFTKADNLGEGLLEGLFGGYTEVINGIIMKPLDLLKDLLSWLLKKLGFDGASKVLDSFSFSDMYKAAMNWLYNTDTNEWFGGFFSNFGEKALSFITGITSGLSNWFKETIWDGENNRLFGNELPSFASAMGWVTGLTNKIDTFIKDNIYDGENNKIFGYEIPEKLFEFNMFNSIKQKVDDVIANIKEIFKGPFTMENLLSKTILVGKTFLDLIWVPLDLLINAVKDIFKFGDPKTPFRMTEFIFGDKDGKGGLLSSIIGFFTNKEGTGIFDFSAPGEEFSIMGIVRKLMTKISDFFTNLFDIDFGSVLEKLIPEGVLGDAFRKLTGLKSPEQIKEEKQEIKNQNAEKVADLQARRNSLGNQSRTARTQQEQDDTTVSVDIPIYGRVTKKIGDVDPRATKEELAAKIAEIDAELAALKTPVMTQTSDSTVNTAEARLGSAVNDNNTKVVVAPVGGGGGGGAPDMRGGNTTVVNNSSKKTETRVSLIDRTRPEQQHIQRFGAM